MFSLLELGYFPAITMSFFSLMGFLSFFCAALLSSPSYGQIVGGTISGIVIDPSGALIPDAEVGVRGIATEAIRAIRTNKTGFYSAPNLAPGEYEITASAPGFEVQIVRLTLTVGAEQELNFKLQLVSLNQSVEVNSAAVRHELQFKIDRKSTRLNSSHSQISYAVFCLKKKKNLCNSAGTGTQAKASHIQICIASDSLQHRNLPVDRDRPLRRTMTP